MMQNSTKTITTKIEDDRKSKKHKKILSMVMYM